MTLSKTAVSVAVQWAVEADHPPFSELDNTQIRRWVRACFLDSASVTIRLVGEAEGRQLNSDFCGKEYATNVLTFPMDLPKPQAALDVPTFMADIVICTPVIEKEAQAQNKDPLHHLAHMVVHGCLHAQGYLHDNDAQAGLMENKEAEILKRFKISNPYVNQAHTD